MRDPDKIICALETFCLFFNKMENFTVFLLILTVAADADIAVAIISVITIKKITTKLILLFFIYSSLICIPLSEL